MSEFNLFKASNQINQDWCEDHILESNSDNEKHDTGHDSDITRDIVKDLSNMRICQPTSSICTIIHCRNENRVHTLCAEDVKGVPIMFVHAYLLIKYTAVVQWFRVSNIFCQVSI